jgi:hypothetical protein
MSAHWQSLNGDRLGEGTQRTNSSSSAVENSADRHTVRKISLALAFERVTYGGVFDTTARKSALPPLICEASCATSQRHYVTNRCG